jgi:hypothetical protein
MAHAKLSPSAAARWMTCPGSMHLTPAFPQDRSSKYAQIGTAIHSLSEKCLTVGKECKDFVGQTFDGIEITQEQAELGQIYVDYVREMPGLKLYEQRVSLEDVIPDCFGTADCVTLRAGHLVVADLKTGAGVRVDVEENLQLLTYALGAFLKFDDLYAFEKITLCIIQPPLNNISVWTIDRLRILQHAADLQAAALAIETEPNKFVMSEKACGFCHVKTVCPEMKRIAGEAASKDFEVVKAENDLSFWLEKAKLIRGFLDSIEDEARTTINQGGSVEGWQLKPGNSTRKWKDTEQLKQHLLELGYGEEQIMSKPEILSPAQMEKSLKGEAIDLTKHIELKQGEPRLVAAQNVTIKAVKDFTN